MAQELVISNLKEVHVGDSVIIQGKVTKEDKRFSINLGQDASNFLIHFNPRFDANKVVVYNTFKNGKWCNETRDSHFPFKQGEEIKISFTLKSSAVTVNYPDGHVFDFGSQLNIDNVKYISVIGDFEVHSIDIK